MLEYGRFAHGRYRPGIGDWKEKIKSGEVQPPEPLPSIAETPPALLGLCEAWGYAEVPAGTAASALEEARQEG